MKILGASAGARTPVMCACALTLLLNASCSTTTTIYRNSGPPIEASVVGGTPTSIVVESDNGQDEVLRSDVYEYDYPGNVHAEFGGFLLGYGLLNIAVGLPKCDEQPSDQQAAFCTGVFLPAVLGAGMLVWGVVVNRSAKTAVLDQSRTSRLPPPNPVPRRTFSRDVRAAPSASVRSPAPTALPPAPPPTSSAAAPQPAPGSAASFPSQVPGAAAPAAKPGADGPPTQ